MSRKFFGSLVCGWLMFSACGGGNESPPDVLGFLGLSAESLFAYQVDVGGFLQNGQVKVVAIDPAYRNGIDAYKVEFRQNDLLIATRWYQVNEKGLFLLGEGASEASQWVERKYATPIKLIPYPIENEGGFPVPSWTTTSDIEQGGAETHRFDNLGKKEVQVPAGTFTAYHLVHTRSRDGGASATLDEYFVPQHWYVKFEHQVDQPWLLAP